MHQYTSIIWLFLSLSISFFQLIGNLSKPPGLTKFDCSWLKWWQWSLLDSLDSLDSTRWTKAPLMISSFFSASPLSWSNTSFLAAEQPACPRGPRGPRGSGMSGFLVPSPNWELVAPCEDTILCMRSLAEIQTKISLTKRKLGSQYGKLALEPDVLQVCKFDPSKLAENDWSI